MVGKPLAEHDSGSRERLPFCLVGAPPLGRHHLGSGSVAVTYDTLRSSDPSDFVTGTTCLETDETDTMTIDTGVVAPGGVDYFIVRVDNDCPGTGSTGSSSIGVPRSAVSCP